ncbi:NADH-quinone oxidoreductase subunit J family protein [Nitrosomonas ureae]|uniref:NADH-quinone oxidoreductase subunit J n=1 Tax=Nitrosomonas ureae TaxID=44577 RepID=A0A1H5X8R9_9PROT|nr:NADH-quinone oxidoreductase subunit J [Nitrosomonas ureae]SEG08144.1 NADH dehydrogenase subunit J [Nitrosomonas ureae]
MHEIIFYLTSAIAVIAAGAILIVRHPVHAAIYLIVSLLALALLFFLLGAPLLAALQVMLYAGAIMVLFLFLIMMMNLRTGQNRPLSLPAGWVPAALLALFLWLELLLLLTRSPSEKVGDVTTIGPKAVGNALFGPYLLVVEAVAVLLLAALVAVLYLSRRRQK